MSGPRKSNNEGRRKGVQQRNKSSRARYGSSGISVGADNKGLPRQTTLTIPKSVNAWMPDRLRTTLRWWNSPAVNLSVTSYGNVSYQPSGAFDIDPALGGTSMPGFNELASIYSAYRVTASHCRAELVNPGITTPVRLMLVPSNTIAPSSPTGAQVINLADQPYAVSKLCSLRGGPAAMVQQGMSTAKIYGSPMVAYDDGFASLVNTVPVNNWYWIVGYYAPSVIPSSEGSVILNVFIEIEIDFFDRVKSVA